MTRDQDDNTAHTHEDQDAQKQGQEAGQGVSAAAGQDIEGLYDQPPAGLSGIGRPTVYTEAVGLHLMQQLEAGRTISAICKDDSGMPSPRTVYRWIDEDSAFRLRLARARAAGGDALVDDALTRLDGASVGKDGTIAREREVAAHQRWMAARMAPQDWGDKVQVQAQVAVTQETFAAPPWLEAALPHLEEEAALPAEEEDEQLRIW